MCHEIKGKEGIMYKKKSHLILLLLLFSMLIFSNIPPNQHASGNGIDLKENMVMNMPGWIDVTIEATPYHVCGKVKEDFHGNFVNNPELLEMSYTSNCQLIVEISFPSDLFNDSIKLMSSIYSKGHKVGQFLYGDFNNNFREIITLPPSDSGIVTFYLDQIITYHAGLETPAGVYTIPVQFTFYPLVSW